MNQIFVVCKYTSDGMYCIAADDSKAFTDGNRALDYIEYLNHKDPIHCYKLVLLDFDQRTSQSYSQIR